MGYVEGNLDVNPVKFGEAFTGDPEPSPAYRPERCRDLMAGTLT
jgi:hypothetical protein